VLIDPIRVGAGAVRMVDNARSHFLGDGVEPAHASDTEVVSDNLA
jgi:hypothetical protein